MTGAARLYAVILAGGRGGPIGHWKDARSSTIHHLLEFRLLHSAEVGLLLTSIKQNNSIIFLLFFGSFAYLFLPGLADERRIKFARTEVLERF
ncbi:MAG: hypothetical protein JNJ44_12465 [Zoogloeaceae bacterium]|nr:hypothetical protein [Zoogloeaceae bacterium]